MINEKASLVQIPSGYKSGTLYSVVPNTSAGDFTVTRGSTATRVNKDGLIESVAANVPRLNYDPSNPQDPHLLLEPQRINRVFPNNSLTGYSTIGVSTTNNSATSPNGANEGAKVQATTSGTAVVFKGFIGTSGVTHNISAFVKAGTHNQVRLQEGFSSSYIDVNLTNGTEVSSQNATNKKIEEYPNGWYRVSFNFTTSGTNLQFAVYFNGTYSSGENIYLYGGQIEEGSYATSLIPTTTGIVTRTADTCSLPNFSNLPTDYPLTVYWKGQVKEFNGFNCAFSIYKDGQSGNFLVVSFNTSSQILVRRAVGGSEDVDFISYSYSIGDVLKIGIKFTSATTFKLFINGLEIYEETSGVSKTWDFNSVLIGQLRISADVGNRNPCNELMIFNEAITDAELITLTT